MAAFDVITEDREELIALLKDWTDAAAAMTAGKEAGTTGAVNGPYDAPPEDTGEALGLTAGRLTLTFGFGPTLFEKDGAARFGLAGPQAGCPDRPAAFPRRRPAGTAHRRGPGGPGLLRRPAGGSPCHPEPGAHRLRQGACPLVPAGLRTHVLHLAGAANAAEPFRFQGRHQQCQGRRLGTAGRARLGARRGTGPGGVDGGRQLPRGPPHPDAYRDLGPDLAAGAGRPDRQDQGGGRPALRAAPNSPLRTSGPRAGRTRR